MALYIPMQPFLWIHSDCTLLKAGLEMEIFLWQPLLTTKVVICTTLVFVNAFWTSTDILNVLPPILKSLIAHITRKKPFLTFHSLALKCFFAWNNSQLSFSTWIARSYFVPKPQRTGAEFLPNDAEFSSCFTEGQSRNFCSHPSVSLTRVTNHSELTTRNPFDFDRQLWRLRLNKHNIAARYLGLCLSCQIPQCSLIK